MSPPEERIVQPRAHVFVLYDRLKLLEEKCNQQRAEEDKKRPYESKKWANRPKPRPIVPREEDTPSHNHPLLRDPILPVEPVDEEETHEDTAIEEEPPAKKSHGMYGAGLSDIDTPEQMKWALESQRQADLASAARLKNGDNVDGQVLDVPRGDITKIVTRFVPIQKLLTRMDKEARYPDAAQIVPSRRDTDGSEVPWYYFGNE